MERWKPEEDKIEKCEEWIGELEAEIKAERGKIPNNEEWEGMTYEDKRTWTKHASSEQLHRAQRQGLDL